MQRLLRRDSQIELLPETFESIYIACCSLVRAPGQGNMLYEMLVEEIDKCNCRLLDELEKAGDADTGTLMDWLAQFVQVCEWFQMKVVRLDHSLRMTFAVHLTSLLVLDTPTVLIVLSRSRFHPKGHEASEYPVGGLIPLRVPVSVTYITYPSDLAFTSFQQKILNDAPIVDCIRQSVLGWLTWERNERSAPHPLSSLTFTHSPVVGLLTPTAP